MEDKVMKLYTNESQTAKLIELGLEKPKSIGGYKPKFSVEYEGEQVSRVDVSEDTDSPIYAYSIGELISFLPDDRVSNKRLEFDCFHWFVDWDHFDKIYQTIQVELVDALYDMCVKFKEEGEL